jgi:hypothetical protein
MTPYIDAGFLATLVIRTPGSPMAWRQVEDFNAPIPLNFLHQLQIENMLVRLQTDKDAGVQRKALESTRLWRNYLAEAVFTVQSTDWDTAFRSALVWNGRFIQPPVPPALLLLHPALAAAAGATHFLSFDPRSRAAAKAAGLKLRPERL